MWSVGCIFAELLLKEPLFQAKAEIELLSMIFRLLGPPTNRSWPEYPRLPLANTIKLPPPQPSQFRQRFQYLSSSGLDLLTSMLTYDPEKRISAEDALQHPYFTRVLSTPSALHPLTHIEANHLYPNTLTFSDRFPLLLLEKSMCNWRDQECS